MTNKKVLSYLILAGLCIELLSPVTTIVVSATSPITSVDTIIPYQVTSSPLVITATNTGPVDNITLFYRYSANNYSDWCPGKDYVILTPGDYKTKTNDTDINYPQRMWYDERNQLLYVVNYIKDNLQVWDVSNSDDISKISQLKHSTYLDYVHDVVVVNNWSYNGIEYGNIAFTVGHASPMYFNSIRVNLSTTPVFLQNVQLSTGESYTKLGYISVIQRGSCLYAAVSRLSGKFNIFNVTDPKNMVNMSFVRGTDIDTGLTNWWLATFDPTNQYLYTSGMGSNQTITTFDVSDLSNPIAIGYQIDPNQSDYAFRYYDKTNLSRLYSINGSDITHNRSLDVFDVSNPEEWTIIAESEDTQGTGEFQTDFWTNDWAASRKWISEGNQTGIIVWNIRNITDIYNAGTFARDAYTKHSHMQWFDYNNSRIFVLALGLTGGNSIYIVKWQISLAQESSWYEYNVDTAAPWSWDFNFPNGAGYYEFCSVGRKAGESDEAFPVNADAICSFTSLPNDAPVFESPSPMNNSIDQPLSLTWSISINDLDGDAINWAVECNNGQTSFGNWDSNGLKSLSLWGLHPETDYTIWVNATDPIGSGLVTREWYRFTTQQQGSAPNKPNKPTGTSSGKINTPYIYSTRTTDPEADQVYYMWDWGDGSQSSWLGPYNSNATINTTHTWTVKTSSIKVKAKDSFGGESPWSDPLPITMPKNTTSSSPFPFLQVLNQLFERLPLTFPILFHLMILLKSILFSPFSF